MNNAEKRIHLGSIINTLIWNNIPFEYNARELVIKLKGIDMTDVLLAIHDCNDEKITDLYMEIIKAKEIIRALLFHLNKDTFAVIYETKKESIEKAEQFLKECE